MQEVDRVVKNCEQAVICWFKAKTQRTFICNLPAKKKLVGQIYRKWVSCSHKFNCVSLQKCIACVSGQFKCLHIVEYSFIETKGRMWELYTTDFFYLTIIYKSYLKGGPWWMTWFPDTCDISICSFSLI